MGDENRVRAESRRDPEASRLAFNVSTPMASPAVQGVSPNSAPDGNKVSLNGGRSVGRITL